MGYFTILFFGVVSLNLILGQHKIKSLAPLVQLYKFRKTPLEGVQLNVAVADDIRTHSLLACSFVSLEGNWDGFAFCKSFSSSNCFLFTANGVPDANVFADLVSCSFYVEELLLPLFTNNNTAKAVKHGGNNSVSNAASVNNNNNPAQFSNLTDCGDYAALGGTGTNLVKIKPLTWSDSPFTVRCEGPDTVIQMRTGGASCDGAQFNASWNSYKEGFGSMESGCFWLGNDKIVSITQSGGKFYKLAVDADIGGSRERLVEYGLFVLRSEKAKYRYAFYSVKQHKGKSNGFRHTDDDDDDDDDDDQTYRSFHTHDYDINSCAARHGAGWWYDYGCTYGNLNERDGPVWPIGGKLTTLESSYMVLI